MQHSDAVSNLSLARCDAAGGDSAQKAVVLHHGHQHGEGVRGAVCRRGYVPDDGVQQWLHRRVLWRAARFGQHAVCPSLQCNVPGIECSQPMKMCITGLGIHPWQQSPLTLTLAGYLTIASSLSGQGQTLSGDANEMKLYAGVPVGLMHRAQGSPAAPPKHPDAQTGQKWNSLLHRSAPLLRQAYLPAQADDYIYASIDLRAASLGRGNGCALFGERWLLKVEHHHSKRHIQGPCKMSVSGRVPYSGLRWGRCLLATPSLPQTLSAAKALHWHPPIALPRPPCQVFCRKYVALSAAKA